jgi:anti-anti-sigma factor
MNRDDPHPAQADSGRTPLGDVRTELRDDVFVARMLGEIDLSNAEQLGVKTVQAAPASATGVVLDLSQVQYIDSYGIFVIHGMRQRLRERGQPLILVVPKDGRIHRTFDVAGITNGVPVVETLEDALRTITVG